MNQTDNILRYVIGVLLSCYYLLVFFPAKGQNLFEKSTVWEAGENHIFSYFVYGLTVTDKGSILAFAEARISNGTDDGAHHIVLKRSTDQGKSFSTSYMLAKSTNGESWANPTVVQDKSTGTIFLFYALNEENLRSKVLYIKSSDDGLSWSDPVSVTSLFEDNAYGWTFHLPGPGHGIQLASKRLIIPVWHRKGIAFPANDRNYGVNCLYSDDHGQTWKVGQASPIGQFNESQLVDQTNGDLLLIGRMRTAQNGSYQAKMVSKDDGNHWSKPASYALGLTGTVCDIGLIRYARKPNILLVSQPARLNQRSHLTIRMSQDDGQTWTSGKLLENGPSTYSDLAVLPDSTIICLYGSGQQGKHKMPTKVQLARFNLEWLKINTMLRKAKK